MKDFLRLFALTLFCALSFSRACAGASPVDATAPTAITSLTMTSDPGDLIGQGETFDYTPANATFTVTTSVYNVVKVVCVGSDDPVEGWTISFEAPNGAPLAVGSYLSFTESSFQTGNQPGFNIVRGDTEEDTLAGNFYVYEITYGPNSTILSLDIAFIVYAEGNTADAFRGEIKYNSSLTGVLNQPPTVNAVANAEVSLPNTLALSGTATDDGLPFGTLTTTWSMVSGPGTVTFGDASALQTTASFSAQGRYVLQLEAFDGQFAAESQIMVVVLDPARPTSLTVTAEGPNPQTYAYTLEDGSFSVVQNNLHGVSISFTPSDYFTLWNLEFAGPNASPLTVGSYSYAVTYGYQPSSQPGINVTSSFVTGSGGNFTVYEAVYGPNGTIDSFHATFTANADDGTPSLTGEIKYNSSTNTLPSLPTANAGMNANVTMPAALALSGTATSDGLADGTLTTTWSVVSGPGTVTFGEPSALQTTASFSGGGVYVLQLLASDGTFSGASRITVNVYDPAAPTSFTITETKGAGPGETYNYTIFDGAFTTNVFDGDLVEVNFVSSSDATNSWTLDFSPPAGSPLGLGSYLNTSSYATASQAGLNVFYSGNSFSPVTGNFTVYEVTYGPNSKIATFDATFTLHAANGTVLTGEIKINGLTNVTPPPIVSAGPNASVTLPNALALEGAASNPNPVGGAPTTAWSMVSGPGVVTFADPSAPQTTATFSESGDYVLELTATLGDLTSTSSVAVQAIDPNAPTALILNSDPGDPIGGGVSYYYAPADGVFNVTRAADNLGVNVLFSANVGFGYWNLNFASSNGGPLAVGSYLNAINLAPEAFNQSNQPVLTVSSSSSGANGAATVGSFNVYQITYGLYPEILAFRATFTIYANGGTAALHGEIRYNATVSGPLNQPPTVSTAASASVTLPQSLALSGTAADDGLPSGELTTTWSVFSGPGPVTFTDPSALQTTATFSVGGSYLLQLTASDGELAADSLIHVGVIDPSTPTFLRMTSDPGDAVGLGEGYDYTLADGMFTVAQGEYGGVELHFTAYAGASNPASWVLQFAAYDGGSLTAGRYPGARGYGDFYGRQPGLTVSGNKILPEFSSGSFNLYELTYGPYSTIASFHATFTQYANGSTAALRGEISYHAADSLKPIFTGNYRGLVSNAQGLPEGGLLVKTTGVGTLTGRLTLNGETYTFKGALGADGAWSGKLTAGASELGLTLSLSPEGALSATIAEGRQQLTSPLVASEIVGDPKLAPVLAGPYALAMTAVDAASGQTTATAWATARIASSGRTWIGGQAPDGAPFVWVGDAYPTGTVLLDSWTTSGAPPSYRRTLMAGALVFGAGVNAGPLGSVQWISDTRSGVGRSAALVETGALLSVQGSVIVPLAPDQEPLYQTTLESTGGIFALATIFGDGSPYTTTIELKGRNAATYNQPHPALTLQSSANGTFTGQLRSRLGGAAAPIDGVFLEYLNLGFGRFKLNGKDGSLLITGEGY